MVIKTQSNLTCTNCGFTKQEDMPTDTWQFVYECASCGVTLTCKEGDCCVFCLYSDTPCPSVQAETTV